MKRFASIIAVLALLCGCLLFSAGAAADPASAAGLKFKEDGTFKIIQVSDLQEVYISSTITGDFLYDLAKREKPDLFVLAGDNISSGAANWGIPFVSKIWIKTGIDGYMNVFDKIYKDFGIPVTMVYGNHDAEIGPDTITRAEMFELYARHESFIGWMSEADEGTEDEQGPHCGTHNLLVYDKTGKDPKFNIWMFDSGSYDPRGNYSAVQAPQIEWFKKVNAAAGKLPSISFQHIIVPEIFDFLTPAAEGDANIFSRGFVDADGNAYTKYISQTLPAGVKGVMRETPCPGSYNYGQYDALNGAGSVLAMFFGHDHVNTFELLRPGTDLVNSPCSGFGSYGDIDLRGVRVITLKESDLSTYETWCISYQGFYGESALRGLRLQMFETLRAAATIFDVFTFKPLFGILGLFG